MKTSSMHDCTDPTQRDLIHGYEMDQLSDSDRERFEAHLFMCPFCLNEVQAMSRISSVAVAHRDELLNVLRDDGLTFDQIRRRLRTSKTTIWNQFVEFLQDRRWQTALAGAAAVIILLGVFLRPQTSVSPYWADLSYTMPPYRTDLTLRGETKDEASRLFDSAMDSYLHGNYPAASKGIKHSLRLDSDRPDRWLYLGSIQYFLQDPKNAVKSLKRAERDGTGLTKTRARWYLAQAYLLQGKVRPAVELLESVAAQGSDHADDARSLLARIAEREPRR